MSKALVDSAVFGLFARHAITHPLDFAASVGPTLNEATFGLLGSSFDPQRDIGDLSGKVILVTGGNSGLGKETVIQLAHHRPSRIYIGARSAAKAQEAIESIQKSIPSPVDIRHIPLDLTSFQSIRAAAQQFQGECDRLDRLVLNAGTMANPPGVTEEGFEIQLGTNHMGHFLLTKLLLPTLLKTAREVPDADVRVVTVSSLAHNTAPAYEVLTSTDALLQTGSLTRYGASKAANVLFAAELARRYPELLSVSLHPGAVSSPLYEHTKASGAVARLSVAALFAVLRSIRSGALNQLFATGVPRERLVNGAYYVPVGRQGSSKYAKDADMGKRFWEWTEEQIARVS
ncbi:putative short-chain dehydrogenase/reductase family protein [Aspergillus taichungensis]|uniref:Putative short-chain dehydrogenase/reductase family protein n=1 Tax=Aspergillus taichungensis TaxID=482145 RepID=A0A2J5HSJ3_9EURO|nr:putative short-chain dehydrogenase/reductase family protein [Aspergillus taichungensis]